MAVKANHRGILRLPIWRDGAAGKGFDVDRAGSSQSQAEQPDIIRPVGGDSLVYDLSSPVEDRILASSGVCLFQVVPADLTDKVSQDHRDKVHT